MGLTRPRGMLSLLVMAVLGSRSDRAKDAVTDAFEAARSTVEGWDSVTVLLAAVGLVVGWVILSRAAGVADTVRRYHRFTLWREGRSYRTRAGLLTQKDVVVRMRKIQMLRLDQGLVQRWFRRYRLETPPVGGPPDEAEDPSTDLDPDELEVPWAAGPQVEEMWSAVFRGEGERLALRPTDKAFERVSRYYIRAAAMRFVVFGWRVDWRFCISPHSSGSSIRGPMRWPRWGCCAHWA